jgi:hypothetical protein
MLLRVFTQPPKPYHPNPRRESGAMRVDIDQRLFAIANKIAEEHVPVGWFPGIRRIVKVIRLRMDIYNALCQVTDTPPITYTEMLSSDDK